MRNIKYNYQNLSMLFLLLLFTSSCKKDVFKNELSGYVREAGTEKALANVEVVLFSSCFGRNLNQPGSCPEGDKKLYKTTTDASGYYCIRYEKYRNNEKYFAAYNDGKHYLVEYAIPDKAKNKLSYDPKLIAPAEIKLHIKNVSPFDGNDEFFIPARNFVSGDPEFEIRLKGKNIDTILGPFRVDGNIDIPTNWSYLKGGVLYRTNLVINVLGFQTTTVDVNY